MCSWSPGFSSTSKPCKINHIDINDDCLRRQPANSKTGGWRRRWRGAPPERSARTTFRRSVSSGRCERDSEDQASAVVGGRSFLASVRNTRQFETFTDGVGGGWVHPLSGARSGCKVSPALPIFPLATRLHDRRQLSCDLMARYADGETLSVFQFG